MKAKKGKGEAVGAVLEARTEASRILREAIHQHGSRGNNKATALLKMRSTAAGGNNRRSTAAGATTAVVVAAGRPRWRAEGPRRGAR